MDFLFHYKCVCISYHKSHSEDLLTLIPEYGFAVFHKRTYSFLHGKQKYHSIRGRGGGGGVKNTKMLEFDGSVVNVNFLTPFIRSQ